MSVYLDNHPKVKFFCCCFPVVGPFISAGYYKKILYNKEAYNFVSKEEFLYSSNKTFNFQFIKKYPIYGMVSSFLTVAGLVALVAMGVLSAPVGGVLIGAFSFLGYRHGAALKTFNQAFSSST